MDFGAYMHEDAFLKMSGNNIQQHKIVSQYGSKTPGNVRCRRSSGSWDEAGSELMTGGYSLIAVAAYDIKVCWESGKLSRAVSNNGKIVCVCEFKGQLQKKKELYTTLL